MVKNTSKNLDIYSPVSIAPMMKWTDRHCRFFHRLFSKKVLLYTEMISANAVLMGDTSKLLSFNIEEHPLAVQLGGSDPKLLASATEVCSKLGYNEINLNLGCPSSRVKKGSFGACLMLDPKLVAKCLSAMKESTDLPISIKCRIGVDDMDEETDLNNFIDEILSTGISKIIIHARKAYLNGLNPKENRNIPPLNYERIKKLKRRLSNKVHITVNGGISNLEVINDLLSWSDSVMIGRFAYKCPYFISQLGNLNNGIKIPSRMDISEKMYEYASFMVKTHNVRLHSITRHMLGLYYGLPGARIYRKMISESSIQYPFNSRIIIDAANLAEKVNSQKDTVAA